MEDESDLHDGLQTAVGNIIGMFYSDDGIIRSRDPKCLQGDLNLLIGLLFGFGLRSNVTNSMTMTFQTGRVSTWTSYESFNRRIIGDGATYWERLRLRIPCPDCRVDLTYGSMMAHQM